MRTVRLKWVDFYKWNKQELTKIFNAVSMVM